MADIRRIREGEYEGEDGFIVTWEMTGVTKTAAEFRAVAKTAMRFPTTITSSEVVAVKEFGDFDFDVEVFVPTEGFASAGIGQPLEWVYEQFDDRVLS